MIPILSDQFKNLTEAQKIYVLSVLVNKTLKSPTEYGLNSDGSLTVGSKLNLSGIFSDTEWIESIFDKAKTTITKDSQQEKFILENNTKIATYLRDHPNESLTEGKVDEILNTKPKPYVEILDKKRMEYRPEEGDFITDNPEVAKPEIAEETISKSKFAESASETTFQNGNIENAEQHELEAMKGRLAELENERMLTEQKLKVPTQEKIQSVLTEIQDTEKRPGLRTMSGDIISITKDQIDQAFNAEINEIYGRKGFLGMGKVEGIKSPEWSFMKTLPASKVLEYFRHPESSDLSKSVINELATSTKHRGLVEQVMGLMGEAFKKTGVEIKPYDNGENMEAFVRRAGEFLMRKST